MPFQLSLFDLHDDISFCQKLRKTEFCRPETESFHLPLGTAPVLRRASLADSPVYYECSRACVRMNGGLSQIPEGPDRVSRVNSQRRICAHLMAR